MKFKSLCTILLPKGEGRRKIEIGEIFELKSNDIAKQLIRGKDVECLDADAMKLDKEVTDEMIDLLKMSLHVLRKAYRPHGFNTGMNIGHSAGAGVADHYHLHVIPRWTGDANFMPLIGETKVVIEDIAATYKKLREPFRIKGNEP